MKIKDSLPVQASLCEYTWEVVACMVMTGEGRTGSDIWPKIPNQGIGTEDMIIRTWSKEALDRKQSNLREYHLLSPTAKETRYGYKYLLQWKYNMLI